MKRGLVAALFLPLVLSACSEALLSTTDIEGVFPTIQRVGVRVMWVDTSRNCTYFVYQRGAFADAPDLTYCQTHDPDNYDDPRYVPIPFDDQARSDLAAFRTELANNHLAAVDFLFVKFDDDGNISDGTNFVTGCNGYAYSPSWQGPLPSPEDEEGFFPIDANWYRVDTCYRD